MIVFFLSLSIYQPNAEDLTEDPRSIRDGEATRFRRLLTEHLNCYIIEKVLCVFVGIKPLKCGFFFFIAITLTPYSMCCAQTLSHVQLFATPWTVAHQSSVHGILSARILERVAISSSRGSSRPRHQIKTLSSPTLTGRFFTTSNTWEVLLNGTLQTLLS